MSGISADNSTIERLIDLYTCCFKDYIISKSRELDRISGFEPTLVIKIIEKTDYGLILDSSEYGIIKSNKKTLEHEVKRLEGILDKQRKQLDLKPKEYDRYNEMLESQRISLLNLTKEREERARQYAKQNEQIREKLNDVSLLRDQVRKISRKVHSTKTSIPSLKHDVLKIKESISDIFTAGINHLNNQPIGVSESNFISWINGKLDERVKDVEELKQKIHKINRSKQAITDSLNESIKQPDIITIAENNKDLQPHKLIKIVVRAYESKIMKLKGDLCQLQNRFIILRNEEDQTNERYTDDD
jgi:chromosome segregation ATPase